LRFFTLGVLSGKKKQESKRKLNLQADVVIDETKKSTRINFIIYAALGPRSNSEIVELGTRNTHFHIDEVFPAKDGRTPGQKLLFPSFLWW